MAERQLDHIPDRQARKNQLQGWLDPLALVPLSESQLEGKFISQVFGDVLGYSLMPTEEASIWVKPSNAHTGLTAGSTPDAIIGHFQDPDAPIILGVIELKSPGTDLDKPQLHRSPPLSPVEQAFDYALSLPGAIWVIVTDMLKIRLYTSDDSFAYWEFNIADAAASDEGLEVFWWLLGHPQLVGSIDDDPATYDLVSRSTNNRKHFRNGFYEAYFAVRSVLFEAIGQAALEQGLELSHDRRLGATQRLLDRMIFIFYCQDHPLHLIPSRTFENVVANAASLPGLSQNRIYDAIRALFREIDSGSPPTSGINVLGYNGELFKYDDVIDELQLPDDLQQKWSVSVDVGNSGFRTVKGVWGLHVFDFWQELGEHMLGSIFEESLSDLVELSQGIHVDLATKLEERRRHGIYYTTDVLADYMASVTVPELVKVNAEALASSYGSDPDDPDVRLEALMKLRIVDIACGSGAFIVSAYKAQLHQLWREQNAKADQLGSANVVDLFTQSQKDVQASLLRSTIFGVDLLPQAVEIAKLALWLPSARPGEKVSDLSKNVVAHDSLYIDQALQKLGLTPKSLDLVIGNPPWGAEMEQQSYKQVCKTLGIDPKENWDSWEIFVLLGLHCLKPHGRLAFVLPETFLYPQKERLRALLIGRTRFIRAFQLGPDWFGANVRMGTMVVEVENLQAGFTNDFQGLVLAGHLRQRVIEGRVPVAQAVMQTGRWIPQERSTASNGYAVELFVGKRDEDILDRIVSRSEPLMSICERARGEEMSKAGMYWLCPSCLKPTVPGTKRKGGGYNSKTCRHCGITLTEGSASAHYLVETGPVVPGWEPWIDGDDIARRYAKVSPTKRINSQLEGWAQKDEAIYEGEKILIRQAGVAIVATIDNSGARCPQSVYIYRLLSEAVKRGYRHEFLLGALLSRTAAYTIFKAFGEIDPDKAHANLRTLV